jgi:DNA-binding NtrC family response regulator
LNIFPIDVPPLRDRADDIPQLVWAFIREFQATTGKQVSVVSPETMEAFQQHDWPGNVRELRNIIERSMIMSEGPVLQGGMKDRQGGLNLNKNEENLKSLSDVERNHIEAVLEFTQWRVRGVGGASQILGLKPTTLEARMRKLGISRPA